MNTTSIVALSIFGFLSLIILITALFSPIARRIGFRNITRRWTNTILVVIGSLVGTALIAGSLVLSDSLDKTFLNLVESQVGEIDVIVAVEEKQFNPSLPIALATPSDVQKVKEVLDVDEIDGVAPMLSLMAAPQKLNEKGEPVLNAYQVEIIGADLNETSKFGQDPQVLPPIKQLDGVYVSRSLADRLDLSEGGKVRIPYGEFSVDFVVEKIYEDKGLLGGSRILVNSTSLTKSFGIPEGYANGFIVSAKGGLKPDNYDADKFKDKVDELLKQAENERIGFTSTELKKNALDGWGLKFFSNIFLVLSMFGIFAGILLIINIYMMLAGERKYEMGILRAIALTRLQLTKTFVFEGFVYSILSSLLGTIVGLGVGFSLVHVLGKMFEGMAEAFGGDGDMFAIDFHVKFSSLAISFGIGATITLITAIIASYKISKLNIVSAIRDTVENVKPKIGVRWILTTLFLALTFLGSLLSFISSFGIKKSFEQIREDGLNGKSNPFSEMSETTFNDTVVVMQAYMFYVGAIFALLGFALLANRITNVVFRRSFARPIATVTGTIAILLTAFMTKFDFVVDAFNQDSSIALFFLGGLVLVIALSIVITYNLNIVASLFTLASRPFKHFSTSMKIAMRYPAVNPSRTGLTLIMFALVIFLIAYISMMKVTMRQMTEGTTEKALGGYEVLVIPNNDVNEEKLGEMEGIIRKNEDVSDIARTVHGFFIMPEYKYKDLPEIPEYGPQRGYEDEDYFFTLVDGLPEDYLRKLDIKLGERSEKYESDQDAWETVINDSSKVILGQRFSNESESRHPVLKVGDKIKIADQFNQKVVEKEVIGFVRIEHTMMGAQEYGNIITTSENLMKDFSEEYLNRFSSREILIKYDEGVDLASEIKETKRDLISYNILYILELSELTKQTQSFMESILMLMQGFLAFSLVVGASGLAIIMARSVQERRQQIGMLRSLGFQKWMILASFFIETTFISFLGIIIGISMGTIGALNAFYAAFKDQPDVKPIFPVIEILVISLLVYVASIIFALLPSIKAAKLSPVEATNYPQ